MESPKRGCDLGPCVLNSSVQKPHCDHFLRFKDFPRGQGLRLGPLRSNTPTKILLEVNLRLQKKSSFKSFAGILRGKGPTEPETLRN